MKKIATDRRQLKYSAPDPQTNIIKVSRILPDNSEEIVGKIFPDYGDGSDAIRYRSLDNSGAELMPPTLDFFEIEKQFEQSIKESNEKSFMEEMEKEADNYHERKESMKELRQWKFKTPSKLLTR